MAKAKVEELRKTLRERDLRVTPSRLAVLDLMQSAEQPMSHAEVVAKLEGATGDPATVYRNLVDLHAAKLLRRTDRGDRIWRFESVRADHEPTAHPHFVCTECGTVECLPMLDLVIARSKVPRALKQREVEVQVRGRCDACG